MYFEISRAIRVDSCFKSELYKLYEPKKITIRIAGEATVRPTLWTICVLIFISSIENNCEEWFCTCTRSTKLSIVGSGIEQLLRATYAPPIGSPRIFLKFIFHDPCPCTRIYNPLNIIVTFAQIQDSKSMNTNNEQKIKTLRKQKTFWEKKNEDSFSIQWWWSFMAVLISICIHYENKIWSWLTEIKQAIILSL